MGEKYLKNSYLWLVYLFLYIPLFILIFLSFNSSQYGTSIGEFTFKWYVKLFNNKGLVESAINSFILAISVATITTIIGTLASVSIFRFNFFGKNFLLTLIYVVLMSPDIVMGISLLILFLVIDLPLGFTTLLITHITFSLPFVVIALFTRLAGFDKNIIEAAKDLGADSLKTFWYIILPSILPAVVAGWLLSFTISMDDSIGSFFTTGPGFEVLPLKIYSMVRLGVTPEVNALSTIIFVLSFIVIIISQILLRDKNKVKKNR